MSPLKLLWRLTSFYGTHLRDGNTYKQRRTHQALAQVLGSPTILRKPQEQQRLGRSMGALGRPRRRPLRPPPLTLPPCQAPLQDRAGRLRWGDGLTGVLVKRLVGPQSRDSTAVYRRDWRLGPHSRAQLLQSRRCGLANGKRQKSPLTLRSVTSLRFQP